MSKESETIEEQKEVNVLFEDPSGQSNALYWDKWFKSVCLPTGRSFEWYCSPSEVERILLRELKNDNNHIDGDSNTCRLFHPGSGNSLLPVYLRDKYLGERKEKQKQKSSLVLVEQCVMDISPVAIEEMKSRHDALYDSNDNGVSSSKSTIDYVVGNVLNTDESPLPYNDNHFNAWIDKGLIDALFGGGDEALKDREECRQLFMEANRVTSDLKIVISLAQDHSLRLMLDAVDFVNSEKKKETGEGWASCIHIYELEPLNAGASSLCPFAFVFRKDTKKMKVQEKEEEKVCAFHLLNGQTESILQTDIPYHCDEHTPSFSETYYSLIKEKIEYIQTEFASKINSATSSNDDDTNNHNGTNSLSGRMMLTQVHIKLDADFLMQDQNNIHKLTSSLSSSQQQDSEYKFLGVKSTKIIPMGFGLSKICLECLMDSDIIDTLEDVLPDLVMKVEKDKFVLQNDEGDEIEEIVQSIDIDWDNTVPVGDAANLLSKQHQTK